MRCDMLAALGAAIARRVGAYSMVVAQTRRPSEKTAILRRFSLKTEKCNKLAFGLIVLYAVIATRKQQRCLNVLDLWRKAARRL